MTPSLADQIIKAMKVPDAELKLVQDMLNQIAPGPHDASDVLVAWTALMASGIRRDVAREIAELHKADSYIVGYIHSCVDQSEEEKAKEPRPQRHGPGDDPHG